MFTENDSILFRLDVSARDLVILITSRQLDALEEMAIEAQLIEPNYEETILGPIYSKELSDDVFNDIIAHFSDDYLRYKDAVINIFELMNGTIIREKSNKRIFEELESRLNTENKLLLMLQ